MKPDFNAIADNLEAYIRDEFPVMASELVMDKIEENFDTESYDGDKWQSLSAQYAKRKGKGKKILSDTGDMRSGVTADVSTAEVTISVDSSYAKYHNEGGSVDGRPPQRQFIPTEENPDNKLEQEIYEEAVKDLNQIIK